MTPREIIRPPEGWLRDPVPGRVIGTALAAAAGFALYGFTIGWWRAPLMGVFTAIKLPLLVALTLGCNALLNGMLGILLGTGLGFRQSFLALLASFAVAGVILGSLAPVTLLLAWNAPPPDSPGAATAHASFLVCHTFLIGFAGVAANLHLHRLLAGESRTRTAATATLLAWLGGNGFLGAQFSYVLRPFFGTPGLEVQFLRSDPLRGNFYETVWHSAQRLSHGTALPVLTLALLALAVPVARTLSPTKHKP